MTNKVIYATVPGFSRYKASSDGKLYRQLSNGKLRQLSDTPRYNGYVCNCITADDGKPKYMQRGFLILMAFAESSYFNGAETDHINRITTDNRFDNLRWLSHRDNCRHRRFPRREKDRPLYLIFDDGSV